MPKHDLLPVPRLHERTILLSAGIPSGEGRERYERGPDASTKIESAVISVARAVFMEGGTLVLGADPSLSPLLAHLIGDYYLPAPAEEARSDQDREDHISRWRNPSLILYPNESSGANWSETAKRLEQRPLVKVVSWPEAHTPSGGDLMRERMIRETSPIAMIAIGGTNSVMEEAILFSRLRPRRPIFALATTGGAAAQLARHEFLANQVQDMDSAALGYVKEFWSRNENFYRRPLGDSEEIKYYVPYPLVVREIIDKLVG